MQRDYLLDVGKGKEKGKEMGMGKEVAKILEKLC